MALKTIFSVVTLIVVNGVGMCILSYLGSFKSMNFLIFNLFPKVEFDMLGKSTFCQIYPFCSLFYL